MQRIGAVIAGLAVVLSPVAFAPSAQAADRIPASGCEPNGRTLPDATHDVMSQKIGDVDLDGHPDTLFHSSDPDTWGVKTSSGAVVVVRDLPLTAARNQHAWALQLEAGPAVLVVDDSRTALPFYLVHTSTGCHFRAPASTSGERYAFALYGGGAASTSGTGVGCLGSDRSGYRLYSRKAVELSSGRYRIDDTVVSTTDGRVAKNGATRTNGRTYSANSETVVRARISYCSKVVTFAVSNGGR